MINKIFKTIITAALAFFVVTGYAYAQNVTLTRTDTQLIYNSKNNGTYVLLGYKGSKLELCRVMSYADNAYTTPLIDGEYTLMLCNIKNNEFYNIQIEEYVAPPIEKEENTTYNPNDYPKDTYERALDAYFAFSMIDSVFQTALDGEIGYSVTFANQGKMKQEYINGDVQIISTSDVSASVLNADAGALKRGDVVYFHRKTDGTIKGISLLMRPPLTDIVTSSANYGTSFEQLFSRNGFVGANNQWSVLQYGNTALDGKGVTQYAFGVSGYKTQNTLYLLNKTGNTSLASEIFMNKNASVYVCDLTAKKGIETGDISSINSNITQKQFFNGGTVSFDDTSYSYALVRLVNGIAVDIAYYIY